MKNKGLTINKISKNTLFIFKGIKGKNNFSTDPTTATMTTIFTTQDPTVS